MQQCQGVGLGLLRGGEALQVGMRAKQEGGWLARCAGDARQGLRVVHGKTPRRLKIDGRQFGLDFVGRGVFVVHPDL
ncbi:hypothetical protein D3C85_1753910 [compost metagenome]